MFSITTGDKEHEWRFLSADLNFPTDYSGIEMYHSVSVGFLEILGRGLSGDGGPVRMRQERCSR